MADKNCNQGCFFFFSKLHNLSTISYFSSQQKLGREARSWKILLGGWKRDGFHMIILYTKKFVCGENLMYFRELNDKKESIEYVVVHSSSCIWLCDPMNCSTPTLPVPHHLPELAQVHVHCTGDAIQPSHPLMPPSPSALNLSQYQGLFQWVNCIEYKYWK